MLLGFKTAINGKATGFVGRILLCPEISPERDTDQFTADINQARKAKRRPKIHTLRTDEGERWEAGKLIHFATGIRTPKFKMFGLATCTGTQLVQLWTDGVAIFVEVDGRHLTGADMVQFYQNDGFDSFDDFSSWFMPLCLETGLKRLKIRLIHWTDFRY